MGWYFLSFPSSHKGRFKKSMELLYFTGVGGFEKVIFYKKNMKHGRKMPKFHLKATYFFKYGGWSDT